MFLTGERTRRNEEIGKEGLTVEKNGEGESTDCFAGKGQARKRHNAQQVRNGEIAQPKCCRNSIMSRLNGLGGYFPFFESGIESTNKILASR